MRIYARVEIIDPPVLIMALGDQCPASRPGRSTLRETAPGTHCIADCVGSTEGQDAQKRK
jgi:hypothetical protein